MKILFTLAVLSTLLTVTYSHDHVYEGPISFFVHVVFDGEFIYGASFISSKYALAPYMQIFQDFMDIRLALLVPTRRNIIHIQYDENNPNPDKFAVIVGSRNQLFQIDCRLWINRAVMNDQDAMTSSKNPAYAIGWQQFEEILMRKIHAVGKTDFSHRHIGIRINNKIDFKKYIGGALIKDDKLIGIAYISVDFRNENEPYVLYLNVGERDDDIRQLLQKVDQLIMSSQRKIFSVHSNKK